MFAAGYNENPEMTMAVMHAGAAVNAKDANGTTPLMYAAKYSLHPQVLDVLLNAGANPKLRDKQGKRALDYASFNGQIKGTEAHRRLYQVSR